MDILSETFNNWLLVYGNFALFGLLALGIIALPVPEETLLVFTGIMIHQGTFSMAPALMAAFLGSVVGITVSYLIGHTGGLYLIRRYGGYVGLTEAKLDKTHQWFEKYGKWMLFIGYFVPGLRHFTGVFAGIGDLHYYQFALFAYTGALCWVLTFLSLGYFFGNYHQAFFNFVESHIEWGMLSILLLVIGGGILRVFYRKYLSTK